MYGQVSPIADMKTVKLLHLIFALLQYAGAQMVTDPNALPCGNDNLSCPGEDQCFNSSMLCDGERFCSVGTDEGMGVDSLNCECLHANNHIQCTCTTYYSRDWCGRDFTDVRYSGCI